MLCSGVWIWLHNIMFHCSTVYRLNEHLRISIPFWISAWIHPSGFPLQQGDSGNSVYVLLHHLPPDSHGKRSHYLCCVLGPASPHPHVHPAGEFCIPGDLVCQLHCSKHADQLPLREQGHLFHWLLPSVIFFLFHGLHWVLLSLSNVIWSILCHLPSSALCHNYDW